MNQQIDARTAIQQVRSGYTILVGGFGLSGTPLTLIGALVDANNASELTVISNNCGLPDEGLGKLLLRNRIRRVIGSYFTLNPDVARFKSERRLEVTLLPQGTLAEAIRAGGAGIPAFYTPTGVGTEIAAGKETREFGGRSYILEHALRGNVALIKAHRADVFGNLTYRMTAQNFNPVMATAADLVIAEVEEIVPAGELKPSQVITPHVFIDLLVLTGPGISRA